MTITLQIDSAIIIGYNNFFIVNIMFVRVAIFKKSCFEFLG